MTRGAPPPRVDRPGGESRRSSARPADAAECRSGRAIVPGGGDDERVQRGRPRRRGGERAVGEGGERLHDADERHAGCVVSIAVLVRIDRELDSCQELIGSAVDGHAARGVRLPARDADRQQGRSRSDAGQVGRAAGPDDEPRHLRAVTLRPARCRRILAGTRIAAGVEHVEARPERSPEIRVVEVDTGIEQRHGHALAREARDPDIDPAATGDVEDVVDPIRGSRRRDRCSHGIDPLDVRVTLHDRERPGIEWSREPVQDAVVRMLGLDRRAVEGESPDYDPLRVASTGRPGPLLLLGCDAAGRRDLAGQRGLREHDEPPASELRRRPIAEEALPTGRRRRWLVGSRTRSSDEQEQDDRGERCPADHSQRRDVRQPRHTHPGRGLRRESGGW